MIKQLTIFLALILPGQAFAASSFEYVDVNRFVGIQVNKPLQQVNPLNVVMTITVPDNIKTIGQAINFILEDSGYVLSSYSDLQEESRTLISLPLPKIHRSFRVQTLRSILQTIIGENYVLMVNPVRREVNFLFHIGKE